MLRWMRETGGDPIYLLLAKASKLRRKGRLLLLAAAIALTVVALAVWLAILFGKLNPWLG